MTAVIAHGMLSPLRVTIRNTMMGMTGSMVFTEKMLAASPCPGKALQPQQAAFLSPRVSRTGTAV
jgi:hypothetical protein